MLRGVDLITRNKSTGDVSLALANGTGWDAPEVVTNVSPSLQLFFADANGDGTDDMITYNASSGDVQVNPSDAGTFGAGTTWTNLKCNCDLGFADANGDGNADLVTRDKTTGEVQLYASDGTATFGAGTHWGTLDVGHDFNLVDVNGDSEADIIGRNLIGDVSATLGFLAPAGDSLADFVPDPSQSYNYEDPTVPPGDNVPGLAATRTAAAPRAQAMISRARNSPPMRLMWQDDSQLVGHNSGPSTFAPADDMTIKRSIDRIQQAGATQVRINVFWGLFETDIAAGAGNQPYIGALEHAISVLNQPSDSLPDPDRGKL